MSDFDPRQNMIEYMAYKQRAELIALGTAQAKTQAAAQAKTQAAAARAATQTAATQAKALNLQKKIGQDLANIESHRLSIERQRLDAEATERSIQREQTEQIRQFRNQLADASDELAHFRKQHLA